MGEWDMTGDRTWRVYSHGGVADTVTADDPEKAIGGYVEYLQQHRLDYGYPDEYELVAVCLETAERVTARGVL